MYKHENVRQKKVINLFKNGTGLGWFEKSDADPDKISPGSAILLPFPISAARKKKSCLNFYYSGESDVDDSTGIDILLFLEINWPVLN
jgi:hypothetical protein